MMEYDIDSSQRSLKYLREKFTYLYDYANDWKCNIEIKKKLCYDKTLCHN